MQATPAQPLRVTQTIVLALAFGALSFTAIVAWLRLSGAQVGGEAPAPMAWTALGLPLMMIPGWFVARSALLARARANRDEMLEEVRRDLHPATLRALTIVGCAMAEGASLFSTVVVLVGGPLWLLGVAVLCALAILAQFPTRGRVEELVKDLAH